MKKKKILKKLLKQLSSIDLRLHPIIEPLPYKSEATQQGFLEWNPTHTPPFFINIPGMCPIKLKIYEKGEQK